MNCDFFHNTGIVSAKQLGLASYATKTLICHLISQKKCKDQNTPIQGQTNHLHEEHLNNYFAHGTKRTSLTK